jgi:periplasmic protein TonB
MSHADTLDRRESLGMPLFGSITVHSAVIATLLFGYMLNPGAEHFGSSKVSPGSVGVTVVNSIPMPQKAGRENRLANDSKSVVPQAPPEKQKTAKAIVPDPKAIPIPTKNAKKIAKEKLNQPLYKPEPYKPNQIYSNTQEALKSSNFEMAGNQGIGIGPNSTLGTRFGYYVDLMRTQIARHWSTGGLVGEKRKVLITFTVLRDGTVKDAKVAQASGNYTLDSSSLRAVLESSPLPQLPPQYEKDSAPVELWFQAKQ